MEFVDPSKFRNLVSGQRRGLAASFARLGLRVAEVPYTLAVRWRNGGYDAGRREIHRVPVPVVSVGNLTLGGTGKTPMVEWVARWLRQRGLRVTVVSRGYGAEQGAINDEGRELEIRLPDVPHVQNPDRVAGALMAIEEFDCQAIVLDDAMQHRRIARDVEVVMLDAVEPFGYEHVFPRGLLREPAAGLARADVVVLSGADRVDAERRAAIAGRVAALAPKAAWVEAVHAPRRLINASGNEAALESLADSPVAAFCGVGNPAGFSHTLQLCGYRVIASREYADHYRYARSDVEWLTAWAARHQPAAVLCTHKDLVKLGIDRLGEVPLWAVSIGLDFIVGQDALQRALEHVLARLPPKPADAV